MKAMVCLAGSSCLLWRNPVHYLPQYLVMSRYPVPRFSDSSSRDLSLGTVGMLDCLPDPSNEGLKGLWGHHTLTVLETWVRVVLTFRGLSRWSSRQAHAPSPLLSTSAMPLFPLGFRIARRWMAASCLCLAYCFLCLPLPYCSYFEASRVESTTPIHQAQHRISQQYLKKESIKKIKNG